MSQFIIAFAIAEAISMIAVGIATAGNALEGFGITAISWSAAWTALLIYACMEISSNGDKSYAPLIILGFAIANFLVARLAERVQHIVHTA
jgi:hypothetical protein